MAQFHAAVFAALHLEGIKAKFVLGISRLENEKPIAEIRCVGGGEWKESSFAGRMFMRWGGIICLAD